ncbi:MAG: hypothetical protein HC806_01110 [Anaerolineae bacterium]|nr:hypothetical protein [Anaerolineae bacterium]
MKQNAQEKELAERGPNWFVAIPIALLSGLIFWWLSNEDFLLLNQIPTLVLFFAPIAATGILGYLALAGKMERIPALGIVFGLLAFSAYAYFLTNVQQSFYQEPYLSMAIIHIPLLAWIGIGWSVLGRQSSEKNRFAFILKSFEILVSAGLFAIAGGIFSGIAIGMFLALGVEVPEWILRMVLAGGAGVIPVIAVASVYDPLLEPVAQTFGQGVSRLMPILIRLLLPSTLVVLVLYIALIPFNFRAPIENRDVLIVNNGMLFAIMGLLLGATPLSEKDIPEALRIWMRRGIIAVASLAVLISLYALTAIFIRTLTDSLTMNRTIVIGWNVANIGILITLLYQQYKNGRERWVETLHKTFKAGSTVYLIWALFVVLIIPWLFR